MAVWCLSDVGLMPPRCLSDSQMFVWFLSYVRLTPLWWLSDASQICVWCLLDVCLMTLRCLYDASQVRVWCFSGVIGKQINHLNCLQAQIVFYSGRAFLDYVVHTLGSCISFVCVCTSPFIAKATSVASCINCFSHHPPFEKNCVWQGIC